MPQVLTAGNHEYPDPRITPPEQHRITPFWHPQFTLSENGPIGLEETAYYFAWQGAFFVVLNGNEKLEEQGCMDGILSVKKPAAMGDCRSASACLFHIKAQGYKRRVSENLCACF
ncbi:MAG: hypothetical protein U9P10_11475 [Thermodesulfobacteriota bacterium]|nr:hypothetical protein [Thermodesulfobacteriota bacterium]